MSHSWRPCLCPFCTVDSSGPQRHHRSLRDPHPFPYLGSGSRSIGATLVIVDWMNSWWKSQGFRPPECIVITLFEPQGPSLPSLRTTRQIGDLGVCSMRENKSPSAFLLLNQQTSQTDSLIPACSIVCVFRIKAYKAAWLHSPAQVASGIIIHFQQGLIVPWHRSSGESLPALKKEEKKKSKPYDRVSLSVF